MKIFLSYRRDDTGGRAGRLFDLLATRFGARNVFHDVTAIAPGLDFERQVEAAIATSDVMLVVIGPRWIDIDADSGRRIDRADDPVRQEVQRALASTIPVVPVLVEGAVLPMATELPDDIASLATRQSVTLRDNSWHDDVEHLIRRLEGDHRIATSRRPRWSVVLAAGVATLVVGTVVVVVVARGGGESSGSPLPPCETDESWTTIEAPETEPVLVEGADERAEFELLGGAWRSDGSAGGDVVVEVAVTNAHDPADNDATSEESSEEGADDGSIYVDESAFPGLLVDRVVHTEISCWGPTRGDQYIRPDQTVRVTLGFDAEVDPAGARIGLELPDLSVLPVATAS